MTSIESVVDVKIKVSEDGMTTACCTEGINCCVGDVGDIVRKLVRMFQLFERDQIKVHGFTSTQCYAILEIWKSEMITMSELSDKMNLNTSTMTRILDNLVRDGFILRSKSADDRRLVLVELTGKGIESARKLNETVNDYYKKIIRNIPEGKLDEVLRSADLLVKAFEKANPNCC